MNQSTDSYRGRFAPSPTGKLHFGSLIAAVASYLESKTSAGEWLVRIEDIDETRTIPGSADDILFSLERFGFEWDDEVVHQSQRKGLYQDYLQDLINKQLVYACDCSRSKLRQQAINQPGPQVYPGNCRHHPVTLNTPYAQRCRTDSRTISFEDTIQGNYRVNLESDCGDFIIKRRDGFFAYQLVVVIDDAEQGITNIVRGADLLDATPQQIYLQHCFGLEQPEYTHVPVAMQQAGQKLSKSHRALAIDPKQNTRQLYQVMDFLSQTPPTELETASLEEFWYWAIQNWDTSKIVSRREIVIK